MEIANQAATAFIQLYYPTYDGSTRSEDVPKFYRPYSSISWNGNPITGPDALKDFLKGIPATSHEIQPYDCHPVPSAPYDFLAIAMYGI